MIKKTNTILFTLYILLCCSAFAQEKDPRKQMDSLKISIRSLEGKEKLEAYNSLAYYIFTYEEDVEVALIYLNEHEKEAYKQKDIDNLGNIKRNIIILLENRGRYDLAVERIPDDLKFFKENDMLYHYYDVYGSYINDYFFLGQRDKALEEAKNLYEESKLSDNNENIQVALYQIGQIYALLGRYEEGEDFFRKSLEVAKKIEIITPTTTACYHGLINVILILRPTDEKELEDLFNQWEIDMKKYEEQQGHPADWDNIYSLRLSFYTRKENWEKVEYYCNLLENRDAFDDNIKSNVYYCKTEMLMERKQWDKALEYAQKGYDIGVKRNSLQRRFTFMQYKAQILNHLGRVDEGNELFGEAFIVKDSLLKIDIHSQLDELRTQYEVDKHIVEKKRNLNYFLLALGLCILLVITLGIRVYYNRLVVRKNKTMAQQIKKLQEQQEKAEAELLNKVTFETDNNTDDDLFCPESRKNELCISIRDIILKDKAYRDPALTRDSLVERLGTNKNIFIDAFQYCFGMPFSEFINNLRLKDAITLLEESDLSMDEISQKVGFGSLRTFQRQFQNKYNMTPKEYRKALIK